MTVMPHAPLLPLSSVGQLLFGNDGVLLLPEMFLAIALVALLLWGSLVGNSARHGRPLLDVASRRLAAAILLVVLALSVHAPAGNASLLVGALVRDGASTLAGGAILVAAIGVFVLSGRGLQSARLNSPEYAVLVLLLVLGALLLAGARDLVVLYLALELLSLSSYALAAWRRHSEWSTEAGLKYFLLGAVSSGMFLFGASLIYITTGSTHLGDMARVVAAGNGFAGGGLLAVGVAALCASLLFKLAAAPFHLWVADVYQGAPTPVAMLFATVPKIALVAVLARLGGDVGGGGGLAPLLAAVAALSLGVGSLGAMAQTRVKRLLAYSGIGHGGYVLASLAVGGPVGASGAMFYMVVYITLSLALWGVVSTGVIRDTRAGAVHTVGDMARMADGHPLLAATAAVALFAMAGVPPLAGFYTKALVFYGAMGAGWTALAVWGVVASVAASYYYLRLVKTMYFDVPMRWAGWPGMDWSAALVVACATAVSLFLIAAPGPWGAAAQLAALAMTG